MIREEDILIPELERQIAEEEKQQELRLALMDIEMNLTFRQRLSQNSIYYNKIYIIQKDSFKKKITKNYNFLINDWENLFNEFWNMLLDEKVKNFLEFAELKKWVAIEKKDGANS